MKTAFLLLFYCSFVFGQEEVGIRFNFTFNNETVVLNKNYFSAHQADSVSFNVIKFYVSGIRLLNNEKVVWENNVRFFLVDAENPSTQTIKLNTEKKIAFNKIVFKLGIDSSANVSGAMGGDLDPTKGMYWTWQSGYINLKLEGKSLACKSKSNAFEFHVGGYQNPNQTLQTIELNAPQTKILEIYFSLNAFLNSFYLKDINAVMSPCKNAVDLSKYAANSFSIK